MTADPPDKMALSASVLLHLAVIVAITVQIVLFKAKPLELTQPIPIDILDLGPVTTTQKQGTGNTAKVTPAPPPTPKPPIPPPQQEQQKPVPVPPKPNPMDKPKPAPEEKFGDVMSKLAKEQPKKPPPKEAAPENFNSLLKNLSTDKPVPQITQTKPDAKAPDKASDAGSKGLLSDKLTISQEDLLRRQIEGCWNVPVGARGIQDMVVTIHILMNKDRTVKSAEIVNANGNDPFQRTVAESAMRAVLNPKCSPFQLPDDKYDLWNDITMSFNPKDIL